MSKYQQIYDMTEQEAVALFDEHGSITKVLSYLSVKNDPRCRRALADKLTSAGVGQHLEKHRPKATDAKILSCAANASSVTEIVVSVGLQPVGRNFQRVAKVLKEAGIELARKPNTTWTDEQVYVENSSFDRRSLATRVKRDGWLPYQCVCGNTGVWNSLPLTLQLDHIDGNSSNNNKQNLRWLCPNCHTQTHTFAGRKNRKDATTSELRRN